MAQYVHNDVRYPFIDEYFHINQCKHYCQHDFYSWDTKITTPPGLYILGTVYNHLLRSLRIPNPCGLTALRSLNLIGGLCVLPLILPRSRNYWKVNIVSIPILYTYYFLFYTDVWSTILVVWTVSVLLQNPSTKGAVLANLIGFGSLFFRQTNITWLLFTAVIMIDRRRASSRGFWESVKLFVIQSIKDWKLLAPFAINGALFTGFALYNGGITLGDKENHQFSLHLVQIWYCAAFIAFFTTPVWLSKSTMRAYLSFLFGSIPRTAITGLAVFALKYVVENFTVVHPFLLADNRHYTFYIYRKILLKKYAEYLVLPVYHFSSWIVIHLLSAARLRSRQSLSTILIIAYVVITSLTLIPSPLFEPRYYIVPLVLLRMFSHPIENPARTHMLEFVWYAMINAIVFIVFFSYEFTWITQPGIQRIIW